jgi:molybdate transport system substrate-binding protein
MKKLMSAALVLTLLAAALFGGGKKESAPALAEEPASELIVFAAASMTEAMNEIAGLYKRIAPNVTIVYNFDSSGTLRTQIKQGAPCDFFLSAGQSQMNEIDITADPAVNKDKSDFVLPGSRWNIVSNQVVMIVPKGSSKGITAFEDALTSKAKLVAIGNSDVPVGQYTEQIFKKLGSWDRLVASGKVTYGSNVKEVLSHVASGAADCGFVYGTDAATNADVAVAAADTTGVSPVYPAAILKTGPNTVEAAKFAAYLRTPEAKAVFQKIGFGIPSN